MLKFLNLGGRETEPFVVRWEGNGGLSLGRSCAGGSWIGERELRGTVGGRICARR